MDSVTTATELAVHGVTLIGAGIIGGLVMRGGKPAAATTALGSY
jgi:hypothetical protein